MTPDFQTFLKYDGIYYAGDIDSILEKTIDKNNKVTSNKKVSYYNIPVSFDIETTSFFRTTGNGEKEKACIMYEWSFGINGLVIIGRTWEEFFTMLGVIIEKLDLNENNRLCIYVHNLAYEFQFIKNWLEWTNVFALDRHRPIYAVTNTGIEFRCSYLLSGYSLAKVGEHLTKYKVSKMVGDLDYSLMRNSRTPLTDKELKYCINDVKVVMAYIQECIEESGDISRIPYTKTGYVRNFCRNMCFYENGKRRKNSNKRRRYLELMKQLTLTPDEYKQLKRAFMGGFTHANAFYSGKILEGVGSFDFTSSYPAVMVAEKFPMSKSEIVDIHNKEEFYYNLKHYCCLFDIYLEGVESVLYQENYISSSRCFILKRAVTNNGRVVSASELATTVTGEDFQIISKFYKWNKIKIRTFRRYKRGYLPKDFVRAILELYEKKTTLKGVEGKETEYLNGKEMLNSCYGMAVTDIVRDTITYTNDWKVEPANFDETIEKYNNSSNRFLFFPWGVWVTAYARRNLFTGIYEFKDDYVYSDTDSIKGLNCENHIEYIEKYNKNVRDKLIKAMDFHGLPHELIEPKTIKGEKKCLGVWDDEGVYSRFKTLGAKRYMVEKNGRVNITVSGLNKSKCVPYLLDKYGKENVFENFNDELHVPADYTGKGTMTYIDDEIQGTLIDYLGNEAKYYEKSCVHFCNSDYSLKISQEYIDYILDVQRNYYM